ncbi:MAG: hypothetical protein QM730_26045 [Anaerolineales bacterium]
MKKIFLMAVLMMILIAACAPQAEPTQQSILPVDDGPKSTPVPTPTHIPVDLTPAQLAAISALADMTGLTADKITLVSTEAVTWPDGCLGVPRMGVMCTQAEVEGFKITLEADGKQYEYHTNQDGSSIILGAGDLSGAVEDSLIEQLAQNLGLEKNDISVVSSNEIEFPDACMGVAMPEIMCAQVVTPGRIIVLEAKGIQYEYHTSADGARVQPATLAFTWKREGGIAGFCDTMTIFLSGEVYTSNCKDDGKMGTFATLLTSEELDKFNTWIAKLGQAELDASDPEGVSDRMVTTLSVFGLGKEEPSATEKDAIFQWVQNLFQKVNGQ